MLPTLRELGIALVPWAPLGSGFLTGTIDELTSDDFRNHNPRYQGDNFKTNKDRFAPLIQVAAELDITPAQLALAWLLHQGDDIVPIPGTRKQNRIAENAAAADITLDAETVERISSLAAPGTAVGQTLV